MININSTSQQNTDPFSSLKQSSKSIASDVCCLWGAVGWSRLVLAVSQCRVVSLDIGHLRVIIMVLFNW